jgi:hypothetical protein
VFFAVLRGADEHFDEVVVQTVEELALEGPLELRIVKVAGVQFEIVNVDGWIGETRADDDFDGLTLVAGIELDERMLVEAKLVLHSRKTVGGHSAIVADGLYSYRRASIGSRREALMAGSIPLIRPTSPRMMVATTTMVGSMINRMSAASAFLAMAL